MARGIFKTADRTPTTLLAITMTTDAALEVATSANAAGFRYVRDPTIGVVSAIKRSCTPSSSSKAALAGCTDLIGPVVRRVISALPGATLLMFAASPLWDEPNALARRRGLWGTKELRWLPADALRTQPLEISGQAGSRFAGVAEIDLERWLDAADFVRTNASSFLFVSTRGEIQSERARATFNAVFPSDSTPIDWGCVIDQIGTGADACIRVSGNFDDRDVAIDVFLASGSFAKLELR